MPTYLVGTDEVAASDAICDYLERYVGPEDHVEAVNVRTSDDMDDVAAGQRALERFEERFDAATVRTQQIARGREPAAELVALAEEVDADELLVGLRRYSRTERIIFGSVSRALLERTTRPVTLVPLSEHRAE